MLIRFTLYSFTTLEYEKLPQHFVSQRQSISCSPAIFAFYQKHQVPFFLNITKEYDFAMLDAHQLVRDVTDKPDWPPIYHKTASNKVLYLTMFINLVGPRSMCDGRRSCFLEAVDSVFDTTNSFCPGTDKYLKVEHSCRRTYCCD